MVEPRDSLALRAFWNEPLDALLSHLATSPLGLSSDEARRRLARCGPNEASAAARREILAEILRLFLNPLVLILGVASIVSAALGDPVGSLIVLAIVLASVALDFFQTYRSQAAAEKLAQSIVTTASVRRDGKLQEIPFRFLVPGDVLDLSAGDLVPVDCRLLRTRFLTVSQAALTGESLPSAKEAGELSHPTDDPAEASNAVFLGTSVVSGTAEAVVVKTGLATELGHIGRSLREKPPATEFERGMHRFANLIAQTVTLLVLFVFFVNAWFGRPALESFLFAVALAVGLTPEFMPMIVTVTLAEGALRMARKRVIVRHLSAIQNLGAIDVLCSDKTGTLTRGNVQVAKVLDPFGTEPDRVADLAYLNATLGSGLRNPLDEAIRQLPAADAVTRFVKVDELPFDFVRRRASVVARDPEGRLLLVTKGAPESVLAVCRACELAGTCQPLGEAERARIETAFHTQSDAGYRSLAIAYRKVDPKPAYSADDERELTFVGLISFEDPPVADAAATIAGLRKDGVALKILTGDDPLIARRVCQVVGLPVERMVTGPELERLTDPALGAIADEVTLFARLTPTQKNRIIGALRARGHVVGFLGDGINDAPSLHSADVGISVAGAVDVAREAAEIILLEPSLAVLHDGIVEGRKSFGNIMKYIMMGTSSNFGNMVSMAGATLFLPFLPLLPVQILLNNLLYDLSQIMLPTDEVDAELTARPKKWDLRLVRDFMLVFGPLSSLFDYLTFGVLWFVYRAQPALFRTGWFVESLATQVLVIYVIRTIRPSWLSRPSHGLVASTLITLGIGLTIPLTPVSPSLGLGVLPGHFYLLLGGAVGAYLALVEATKRWFFHHHRL